VRGPASGDSGRGDERHGGADLDKLAAKSLLRSAARCAERGSKGSGKNRQGERTRPVER
jgi:hypothetical protein